MYRVPVMWPAVLQEPVPSPAENRWKLRYLGPLSSKRNLSETDDGGVNAPVAQTRAPGLAFGETSASRMLLFPGRQRISVVARRDDSLRPTTGEVLAAETFSDPNKVGE